MLHHWEGHAGDAADSVAWDNITGKPDVALKTKADTYLIAGSVEITGREDHFTHTTETRTKIEKSSGSGGTTVDSDGFSSKSGKF